MMERAAIEVTGLVQGVGFRPFIYSLATSLDLRGFVQNRGAHVFVDIEGEPGALHAFVDRLAAAPPPHASIERVQCQPLTLAHHQQFVIADSRLTEDVHIRVPADVATCDDCLAELFDQGNRRHRHPFITCTTCGPRFSIIRKLPYDRADTAMAAFAMCDKCLAEYSDPGDRRFHAQAIACPDCGPTLTARDSAAVHKQGDGAIRHVVEVLLAGGIVAIKGIGGFHLACDATNETAVAELRRRKGREAKPFAVMFSDADGRRLVAHESAAARAALSSPARPIVLVDKRALHARRRWTIAANVSESSPALGVLLPYAPVHHLLLHDADRPLVMTSGNRRDEPMVYDERAAIQQLGDIADVFLTHDRRIDVRCDDSVVRARANRVSPVRRGRGHAPAPLLLAESTSLDLLAVGGHLKNTFCLATGAYAYVSPHIGNLDTAVSYSALGDTVSQMSNLLNLSPEVIAHDSHPDYQSTRFASAFPAAQRVAVQHHHAHVLSCVAEHRCTEPVIGVAFDGAGLGTDGAIWGGEFLIVEGTECHRAAHLSYVPLPGGDVAAREPWRMAVAHLASAFGSELGPLGCALAGRIPSPRVDFLKQMIARGVLSPSTSSMGRLFDAVAALIGLRDAAAFEGQAAMELEAIATAPTSRQYRFELDTSSAVWRIDAAPVIRAIAADVVAGRLREEIASAFHESVGTMIATTAARIARRTGIGRVALTGGVFQNALLGSHAARALNALNLDVLEHRVVPCNDGGLSLGQALFALRIVRAGRLAEDHTACA